jgi:hypothetical protein
LIEVKTFLAVVIVLAVVGLVLYFSPFATCLGCPGKSCRRCRGLGRYQRRGSRIVHRLARSIRKEIERTREERREAAACTPEKRPSPRS